MAQHKTDKLVALGDLGVALALLTRVPMPKLSLDFERSAAAAWAWPLVGAFVGALGGFVALLALWLGMGNGVAAVLALSVMVLVTGALHEDGLADVADGFWGGFERARRLEIMKDSRIGAYGVLALVLSVALRLALLAELGSGMIAALIVAAALGRAAMAALMAGLPNARGDGLSAQTGRPSRQAAVIGGALALGLAFLLAGSAGIGAVAFAALAAFGCGVLARRKIGGQTGDVLGASGQMAEIAALMALVLFS